MLSELVVEEYRQLKKKYPQEVLLLQVGIFYKILLEDARQLAGELGLKLITISKPEQVGCVTETIAFCGFPLSGLDKYIGKLVRRGKDVTVCNQIKIDGKIVKWEVKERIVLNNNGRLSE